MITCGRCTKEAGSEQKHETVADVHACYAAPESSYTAAMDAYYEAEARAEAEAERRAELWWENRGADDGFDEWEARRGVIDFATARDLAEATS